MNRDRLRAHVVIPEDLLREVDALVGNRKRSDFLVEAAREKVAREKLRRAAHRLGGTLADTDIPGWETSESTREWVRSLRRESDERRLPDPKP
ncbi:MAG: hypothetical protein JOZ41_16870 [Chloroflexi bacterium]|nr:hypothetical protein [Chloroflexota bacterium]